MRRICYHWKSEIPSDQDGKDIFKSKEANHGGRSLALAEDANEAMNKVIRECNGDFT